MSKYHKDLTNRVGKELGFEDAVLDEDYANIWHKAGSKLDDLPAGKGPFRDVDTKPETVAEKEAAYRWTQKRTFNLNDQWDAYKRGVIKDLRRLGVDEQGIQMVKELPRGSAPREGFAQYLYKSAQLPATAKPILQAWQAEIEDAYIQFQHLSRGDTFTRAEGAVSPVAKMNENLFASSRSANGTVADALRETADLYEGRGDMGRATAYNRAADIITTKGAPNLVKLAEKGEGAIVDAFKGQGGIGQSIEKDIFEIMSGGSSEKLDALRTRVPEPSFPGPGAMSKNELVKPKYGVINYSASGWKHLIGKYDTEAAAKAALREAKERAGRSFITGRNPFEGEIVKLNKNGTFPPGKGPDF